MTGYEPDRDREPHWRPVDERQLTVTVERPLALGYPEHLELLAA